MQRVYLLKLRGVDVIFVFIFVINPHIYFLTISIGEMGMGMGSLLWTVLCYFLLLVRHSKWLST